MNKKVLVLGILGVCLIGLVAAISYYAMFSATFEVQTSIVLDGNTEQTLLDVFDGGINEGTPITITNNAPTQREISFSEETECAIETSYASSIDMFSKEIVNWTPNGELTATLSYVIVGDEFMYKVLTENDLTDYVVIYYPDIDGNPGSWNIDEAILVGDIEEDWTVGNADMLPLEDDWNDRAKLWLIPSADWTPDRKWNPSVWLFENNRITYGEVVILQSGESIIVTPLYDVATGETGECTVTTTVA